MTDRLYKKVLVVDDDESILKIMSEYLSRMMFICEVSLDAEAALKTLKEQSFDFVISDIEMPGMDGIEFMMKAKESFPDLDFIMMTGYSSAYAYVDIINSGAADYMTKPIDKTELNARIVRIERERLLLNEVNNTNDQLQKAIERANRLTVQAEVVNITLQKEMEKGKKASDKIRVLSITDPLTGCFNRGYIDDFLPKEIERARRYKHSFSVVLCDLDHFKEVNDTFGHRIGDCVLKEFVVAIRDTIREEVDWVARYGGEEFLMCLPETDVEGACCMLDRLCDTISKSLVCVEGKEINLTISCGVTGFDQDIPEGDAIEEIILSSADKYLYQAKKEGRNRVVSGSCIPASKLDL